VTAVWQFAVLNSVMMMMMMWALKSWLTLTMYATVDYFACTSLYSQYWLMCSVFSDVWVSCLCSPMTRSNSRVNYARHSATCRLPTSTTTTTVTTWLMTVTITKSELITSWEGICMSGPVTSSGTLTYCFFSTKVFVVFLQFHATHFAGLFVTLKHSLVLSSRLDCCK